MLGFERSINMNNVLLDRAKDLFSGLIAVVIGFCMLRHTHYFLSSYIGGVGGGMIVIGFLVVGVTSIRVAVGK